MERDTIEQEQYEHDAATLASEIVRAIYTYVKDRVLHVEKDDKVLIINTVDGDMKVTIELGGVW
ncbi:hypothetical protein KAR91_85845 [Candidatus Pacearchaeota archaeon]|nr:hypothetical protein [Candidatus Pacearchaeota archaeon]